MLPTEYITGPLFEVRALAGNTWTLKHGIGTSGWTPLRVLALQTLLPNIQFAEVAHSALVKSEHFPCARRFCRGHSQTRQPVPLKELSRAPLLITKLIKKKKKKADNQG